MEGNRAVFIIPRPWPFIGVEVNTFFVPTVVFVHMMS